MVVLETFVVFGFNDQIEHVSMTCRKSAYLVIDTTRIDIPFIFVVVMWKKGSENYLYVKLYSMQTGDKSVTYSFSTVCKERPEWQTE